MGTNFLHGKKTYTTATLILVGATQVGLFSCLLTLLGNEANTLFLQKTGITSGNQMEQSLQ